MLHMKLIAYVTNAPAEYMNTYEGFAQRDGEDIWQTCFREDTDVTWIQDWVPVEKYIAASGMRRCAGETDPTSGINCLMLWMNGNQYPRYVLVSNIVVLGPIPVLSIERSGANIDVTYSGTLQSADFVARAVHRRSWAEHQFHDGPEDLPYFAHRDEDVLSLIST